MDTHNDMNRSMMDNKTHNTDYEPPTRAEVVAMARKRKRRDEITPPGQQEKRGPYE